MPAPRSPRQRPTLEVQPASTPRWWLATKKVKKNALSLTNTVTPGFGSNVLLINGIILSKPCRCRVYLGFRSLIAAGKESFLLRPVGSLSIDCSRGEQLEQPAQSTRSHLLYNGHLQLCTQCIRSRCLDQSNSKNLLVCLLEQPIQKVLNRQRRHKKQTKSLMLVRCKVTPFQGRHAAGTVPKIHYIHDCINCTPWVHLCTICSRTF